MTMRTFRFFRCPNGHEGTEKTSENDQPYSTMWESVVAKGMRESGKDQLGNACYFCGTCGQPMTELSSPN